MPDLKHLSLCAYLTDTDVEWRDEDYVATKMVKALKGDSIEGYFDFKIGEKVRRFDQSNVSEFVERIPRALARMIARHYPGEASLVPIPNSHVIASTTPGFKTLELAEKIAANGNGKLKVVPTLVFGEVQQKSREGGPRDPKHFESAYRIVRTLSGPVILVDDVCTSGGHLVAAYWRLNKQASPVVLACTFGKTTKAQLKNPIGMRAECAKIRST
ncbi:phosphoribosylpyrophosphate synthetase [Bradyrhizobium sp. LM3.4]